MSSHAGVEAKLLSCLSSTCLNTSTEKHVNVWWLWLHMGVAFYWGCRPLMPKLSRRSKNLAARYKLYCITKPNTVLDTEYCLNSEILPDLHTLLILPCIHDMNTLAFPCSCCCRLQSYTSQDLERRHTGLGASCGRQRKRREQQE